MRQQSLKTRWYSFLWMFLGLSTSFFAQNTPPNGASKDSLGLNPFLNTVTQSLQYFYADYANSTVSDSIIKALNYEPDMLPEFSDKEYCERLDQMNQKSPFGFDCNNITLNSCLLYTSDAADE